jgi:molybdopterin-synthase adenylyltransferase
MADAKADDAYLERYSRNILLREIGLEGQARIRAAKVLIVGVGGLGSPAAFYLAAAGVGTLGLADGDAVELSNLQRQIVHDSGDIGRAKVVSAAEKIARLNPDVAVNLHRERLVAANAADIVAGYDFVIDATDGFESKFLINDSCVVTKTPFSHGGVMRFTGQTMTVRPGRSACYRCVFEAPPPEGSVFVCSEVGVLGAVAGMLGTIQAVEAIKIVTGVGAPLTDALLTFDALAMSFRKVPLKRNPACPVCGNHAASGKMIDGTFGKSGLKSG